MKKKMTLQWFTLLMALAALLVPQVQGQSEPDQQPDLVLADGYIQSGVLTPDVVRGYNLLGYGTAGPGFAGQPEPTVNSKRGIDLRHSKATRCC